MVTTAIDAEPIQCLRVPGPSFIPMVAAIFIGGSFIFATFAWYWMAVASGLLGVAAILAWLWVGTAEIPEKAEKAVGLGLTLPLYASGPAGVGWRSEEHTSELQSLMRLSYAVFCLKKKN